MQIIARFPLSSNSYASYRADAVCALLLCLLAAALASWVAQQFHRSGTVAKFYQEEFTPAVMFACGKGLHNVEWVGGDPALSGFLLQRRDALDCGELASMPTAPQTAFQRISLYLELALGLLWRVTGVSWSVVVWLEAFLGGLFAVAIYAVMRLGMRRPAAALLSTVVVSSPLHLSYLPQLRDYSKAPFLLALVWFMGVVVTRPLSNKGLLCLSAAAGVAGGVGFGFRTDILLAVPVSVLVLLCFRSASSGTRSRAQVFAGLTASLVFLALFGVTAAPVLQGYARGGNVGHVILLGLSSPFDPRLGVEAKHYQLSTHYDDLFQETVVRSYGARVDGDMRLFSMGSDEYDRESGRYLTQVMRTFPADVTVRAVSGVVQILRAPFSPLYTRATNWVVSGPVRRIYDRRADALDRLPWLGCGAVAVLVAGLAAWQLRYAVFVMFLIIFLAGGAAIQFDPRHFFYLEFLSWWAIGVIADGAAAAVWNRSSVLTGGSWASRERLARASVAAARSAALLATCACSIVAALLATRHYQQIGLNSLFERALSTAGQPLIVRTMPAGGGERLMLIPDLPELTLIRAAQPATSIGTAYLLLDVSPGHCDSLHFLAMARYETSSGIDFTAPVTLSLADSQSGLPVKILLPVYSALYTDDQSAKFVGFELTKSQASCIDAIRKVGDIGTLPVLVTAILGPDWRAATHYQTMSGVESRQDGTPFQVQVYLTVPTIEIGRSLMWQAITNPWPDAVATARVTAPAGSGVVVDGRPESGDAYLLQYRERWIQRGTCAVAAGDLAAGGLTFGLLRNGSWYQFVNVVDRGRFVAAGCALEDDNYAIVLANNNPANGVTRARLDKIGWAAGTSIVWAGR